MVNISFTKLDSWRLWCGSLLLGTLERGSWKALQLWWPRSMDPCGSHSDYHRLCRTWRWLSIHILDLRPYKSANHRDKHKSLWLHKYTCTLHMLLWSWSCLQESFDSNQWKIFGLKIIGDKRVKCSPGLYCNETPQFPWITLLKLSLVLGGQTKLGWYNDQEVWKCLALSSSLWVIDNQEILIWLSNKRSGTLTVMFKHNGHDKQVLYFSWVSQKYSGVLLPGKLTTAELGHWTSIHCYRKNIPRKWENFVGMKKL